MFCTVHEVMEPQILLWQYQAPVAAPGLHSRVPPSVKLQHSKVLRFHDGSFLSDLLRLRPTLMIPVVAIFCLWDCWETEALCLSACVLMSVRPDVRLCLTNPSHTCYSDSGLARPAARWIWSWMSTFSPPRTVHPVIFTHSLSLSPPLPISLSRSLSFARTSLDPSAFGTHKQWSGPGRDSSDVVYTWLHFPGNSDLLMCSQFLLWPTAAPGAALN